MEIYHPKLITGLKLSRSEEQRILSLFSDAKNLQKLRLKRREKTLLLKANIWMDPYKMITYNFSTPLYGSLLALHDKKSNDEYNDLCSWIE